MKLVIINGSPRGKGSNSNVITNWIVSGFDNLTDVKKFYAPMIHTHKEAVESIDDNTSILVIFPLYVDAMPGIMKLFFEELDVIAKQKENVKIYFVVHSGFGGAKHSRAIERYLEYLSNHLGFKYMGTAIKPSSEGFRLMPEEYTKDVRNDFLKLSKNIEKGVKLDDDLLNKLAGFEVPSEDFIERIRQSDGETEYFSYLLKKNNSFDNSFDKPYKRRK